MARSAISSMSAMPFLGPPTQVSLPKSLVRYPSVPPFVRGCGQDCPSSTVSAVVIHVSKITGVSGGFSWNS